MLLLHILSGPKEPEHVYLSKNQVLLLFPTKHKHYLNLNSVFLILFLFSCPAVKTRSYQVCSLLPLSSSIFVKLNMASMEILNRPIKY